MGAAEREDHGLVAHDAQRAEVGGRAREHDRVAGGEGAEVVELGEGPAHLPHHQGGGATHGILAAGNRISQRADGKKGGHPHRPGDRDAPAPRIGDSLGEPHRREGGGTARRPGWSSARSDGWPRSGRARSLASRSRAATGPGWRRGKWPTRRALHRVIGREAEPKEREQHDGPREVVADPRDGALRVRPRGVDGEPLRLLEGLHDGVGEDVDGVGVPRCTMVHKVRSEHEHE